jgi:hypothetical protein
MTTLPDVSHETVAVHITQTMIGTALCAAGDYHEDALDAATLPVMQGHAAMHAMTTGHEVTEHITRDLTISPVLW